jgi:ribosomal-protein-alanine N-acetyltransferase
VEYIFQSERLGFREWLIADHQPYSAINLNPKIMQYFPNLLSLEETRAQINRINEHFDEYGYGLYAVDLLSSGEFIGFIGFSHPRFKSFFTPCVEIGWRLSDIHWHKGLATEGAKRCIAYAKEALDFTEIYSMTPIQNIPSQKVMIKLGMTRKGSFLHPLLKEGDPLQECHLYYLSLSA